MTNILIDTLAAFDKPWGNFALKGFVETQAPESINWLPQTLGWKIVLIVTIFWLFKKSIQAYQLYQRNAYRRDAVKWLYQLKQTHHTSNESQYRQLPTLLRKTALCAFKRSDITTLTGASWEQWLDKQCPKSDFQQQCPNILSQLAFAPSLNISDAQMALLIEQIDLWIKFHRRQDD
jgi:hypothetical protein